MKKVLALILMLALPLTGICEDDADFMEAEKTENTPSDNYADDFPFPDDDFEDLLISDPLEPLNRGFFWFNDKLYFYFLKPVAKAFRYVPEPWRISIKYFFNNLAAPVSIVNAGLQGKFGDAGNELTRFLTNTTLGIGGLFDPSREHFGINRKNEDTGQTLGHYGIGTGPYLVLPFLGPSDLRDAIGGFGDTYLDISYYLWRKGKDNYDYIGSKAVNAINAVSLDKDTYEGIKQDALDPYLYMRDAYSQYRKNLVKE
ncbi:MAG: VacJ family lipoprotein [Gammaproteobacteria bacterium]